MILGDAMAEAVACPTRANGYCAVAQAYVDCARARPERFRLMFGPLLASRTNIRR